MIFIVGKFTIKKLQSKTFVNILSQNEQFGPKTGLLCAKSKLENNNRNGLDY